MRIDDNRVDVYLPAAVCLAVLAGMAGMQEGVASWLEYDRLAIAQGELWRLWSGHLVHFTAGQAAWDGLALLVPALWLLGRGARSLVAGMLLLMAPAVSLALFLLVPDMAVYRGASALAVGLWVFALAEAWRAYPALRPALWAAALVLCAKLAAEPFGGFAVADLPAGVAVAWQAHWAGVAFGALSVLAFRLAERGSSWLTSSAPRHQVLGNHRRSRA